MRVRPVGPSGVITLEEVKKGKGEGFSNAVTVEDYC